jgi:hypothetical protein
VCRNLPCGGGCWGGIREGVCWWRHTEQQSLDRQSPALTHTPWRKSRVFQGVSASSKVYYTSRCACNICSRLLQTQGSDMPR